MVVAFWDFAFFPALIEKEGGRRQVLLMQGHSRLELETTFNNTTYHYCKPVEPDHTN